MSTLNINLNEEYKIKIEKGNDFHESIFSEVYINAAKNVVEIIKQSEIKTEYDDFNNIIAFTGERGKGKSSSMISFRNALINNQESEHKDFFDVSKVENESLYKIFEILKNNSFAEIDIIDPSRFRNNESLFEIILAKMFSKFQNEIKDNRSALSHETRRTIIKLFQNVFENLHIINSDRKDLYKLETIEALSKLATSSNLRECFKELVKHYLKHFENKDFLILAIDDFDLNILGAYEMLEDIRQFLIQNKIIILIACKIEQLNDALELHFENLKLKEDIKNKANRYLDKLIPFSRRTILPQIDLIKKLNLIIKNETTVIFDNRQSDIIECLTQMIYKNKAILVTKSPIKSNSIFPKTIRETQSLFNLLQTKNEHEFLRKYIIDEIYKKDIFNEIFFELHNCSDIIFNLLLIRKIADIASSRTLRDNEVLKLARSRIPENISIGDVIHCINELENLTPIDNINNLNFIDYLKLYYIIRLHCINPNLKELEVLKYGFFNGKLKIISEDSGNKSREIIRFDSNINVDNLSIEERFIISAFMFQLGDGENYRNDLDKELFVIGYKKGILSPYSIFNNIKNIDILSEIFKYDQENDFVRKNLEWFNNSSFINQLFNPYFTINLFSELNKFRKKEIKATLPKNYIDVICLLFVYGILNSLHTIEEKHNIKGLVEDYLKFPIISSLIEYFIENPENLKYKKVKELNDKYLHYITIDKQKKISKTFIELINRLYENSDDGKIGNDRIEKDENIYKKLKLLTNRINKNPQYQVVTLSTIINEIRTIDEFHPIVEELNTFRQSLNNSNEDTVKGIKNDLKNYLREKINGQSS
jgi:hypothetical protein